MQVPKSVSAGMNQAMHKPYSLDYASAEAQARVKYNLCSSTDTIEETRLRKQYIKQKNLDNFKRYTDTIDKPGI